MKSSHLFHVLLVHTQEVIEHDRWFHFPEPVNKLADATHRIFIIRIAGIKAVVYQQRCHRTWRCRQLKDLT